MIGPFRQPPERRYIFTGFGASRSGTSGEQAVDLLITEALLNKGKQQPLIAAVSYWLKVLKLADALKIKDIAKHLNLFEVDVKLKGKAIRSNLADVGFGVSQVLPVLVQGLLMKPGGIYFVQEPEIHLHPDAQANLADFFIYLASQGVICVIETHSEYLLLRLRRRLAEKAKPSTHVLPKLRSACLPLLPDNISVLFCHTSGGRASITRLEIGGNFQFENLPVGFMSQITDDRIALLQAVNK
jgi:predicted ATPase